MFQNKRKWSEFIRYCIVGTIATGVHYGIYYLLQRWINVNIAYTVCYAISIVGKFFLSRYLSFRSDPSGKSVFGFGGSHLVNYLLHMFLLNFFLYLHVSRELAPLLVLAVAVPTNFLLLRWVFKTKKGASADID